MNKSTDEQREDGDNWRRFGSRAFWPVAVLLLVFAFRSEVSKLLENVTHFETGPFEADITHQGRVALSIHDVLLSVPRVGARTNKEGETVTGPMDPRYFDRLIRLFNDLDLEHLPQKRILWVNSVVTEEDLDLANAFTALGIQVFHARNNCSAKRHLLQDKYSLIITGMWRSRDDLDAANCARDIELPPDNAPPEIRYAGGLQFLEYMLDHDPNHTPVVVFSGLAPYDPILGMHSLHVAEVTTLPPDVYEFVLKTLSRE